MKAGVLSVLVSNHYGVLTRVSNLFTRRGYNIKALTGGETENPAVSRITIAAENDKQSIDQIRKQLEKLEDVKKAIEIENEKLVARELVLVKTPCNDGDFGILAERISPYNARIISLKEGAAIVEMTGRAENINAFIEYMQEEGIMEMCRTGLAALESGKSTLYDSATKTLK